MKEVERINERELRGKNFNSTWHDDYRESSWIYFGSLSLDLNEGDVLTIFAQYQLI